MGLRPGIKPGLKTYSSMCTNLWAGRNLSPSFRFVKSLSKIIIPRKGKLKGAYSDVFRDIYQGSWYTICRSHVITIQQNMELCRYNK